VFQYRVDPAKEAENVRKHGVGFDDARAALRDPMRVTWFDESHSAEELRFVTLGCDLKGRVLVVVTSEREPSPRIISARRATKRERHAYEERRPLSPA
jgi:uncharacterized protein